MLRWQSLIALLPALAAHTSAMSDEGSFAPYERSLAMVRAEIERHPTSPRLLELLADVHRRAFRYVEAAGALEGAVAAHPRDAGLLAELGEVYLEQERLDDAGDALKRALAIVGDRGRRTANRSNRFRLSLAAVHERAGRFRDVIRELDRVVKDGGASPDVHFRLGRALDSEARGARATDPKRADQLAGQARKQLERAIALDAEHAQAHYTLGRLLMRRGERDHARRLLSRFRSLRSAASAPTEKLVAASHVAFESETGVSLARVLASLGDIRGALRAVDRAMELSPGNEGALAFRARLYMLSKKPELAMRDYGEILTVRPDHAVALWNVGRMHLTAGRVREAEDHLMRAVRSHASADQWEFLAKLAASRAAFAGRTEEFARRALESRRSPENHVAYAMALVEAGRVADCERVLREGLERFPGNPDLIQGLRAIGRSP